MTKKVRQFSELTEEELEQLRKQMKERAVREGTDLLEDVVCLWVEPKRIECPHCKKLV